MPRKQRIPERPPWSLSEARVQNCIRAPSSTEIALATLAKERRTYCGRIGELECPADRGKHNTSGLCRQADVPDSRAFFASSSGADAPIGSVVLCITAHASVPVGRVLLVVRATRVARGRATTAVVERCRQIGATDRSHAAGKRTTDSVLPVTECVTKRLARDRSAEGENREHERISDAGDTTRTIQRIRIPLGTQRNREMRRGVGISSARHLRVS